MPNRAPTTAADATAAPSSSPSLVSVSGPGEAPDSEAQRLRARRHAWVSLLVFFATLFAFDQGFRVSRVSRRIAAESLYISKPRAFSETPTGADVVVVGDSRVLHGIDPRAIETVVEHELGERIVAWNAGLSGAPPMAHLAWVRRMLTHAHRPRLVVLSISPYMFSSRIAYAPSRESLTTIYRLEDLPTLWRAGAPLEDLATVLNASIFESVRHRPRVLELMLRFSGLRAPAALGEKGWLSNGDVDPAVQDSRARGRGMGYRTEMRRPEARFGNEQVGYFLETLRALREAGVRTLVLNSPSASQIDLAYGPESIYDEHIRFVRETAARFGAGYADVKDSPAITDADYTDGDHLSGGGASRFSAWLAHEHLVPALGTRQEGRPAGCRTVHDFEDPAMPGWRRSGQAFSSPVVVQGRRRQQPIYGITGQHCITSYVGSASGDSATGTAVSPPFTLEREVRVRVAGGSGTDLSVALVVDGREVAVARGQNDEILRDVVWDTAALQGQTAELRITDNATGPWGHLDVDDLAVCP
jgi:hypothetical protein